MVTVPLVGRTSPHAIFTSVDLPAPFAPDEPDELARRDRQPDLVERDHRSVALTQPGREQRRRLARSGAVQLHRRSRAQLDPCLHDRTG